MTTVEHVERAVDDILPVQLGGLRGGLVRALMALGEFQLIPSHLDAARVVLLREDRGDGCQAMTPEAAHQRLIEIGFSQFAPRALDLRPLPWSAWAFAVVGPVVLRVQADIIPVGPGGEA